MRDTTALLPLDGAASATDPATMTAVSYLGGFTNRNTRSAYMTDLRIYFNWCSAIGLNPLDAKRGHVQAFAVHLAEARGNGAASVCRRIGTVTGFYDTAVVDEVLEHSPAHHLRLPKIHDDPARRTWLTRWELGAVMRAARESKRPADWALINILGTLGMRVSATCAIQVEDMTEDQQGYRTLHTIGKGAKPSVKVLPVPTWKSIDRARGGRPSGPLLLRRDGTQMTRRSASIVVQRLCRDVGITRKITPHSLRRSFATLAIMAGVPMEVVSFDMDHASSRTTSGYNRLAPEPNSRAAHTVAALLASAT